MRLKETKDNWKASNVERKIVELPAQPKPRPAKKNTHKWCKGKEGRLHDPRLTESTHLSIVGWAGVEKEYRTLLWTCATCGKRFYDSLMRNVE